MRTKVRRGVTFGSRKRVLIGRGHIGLLEFLCFDQGDGYTEVSFKVT